MSMAVSHLSPISPPMSSREETKVYACIGCTQRKVKCDRAQPCLACSKSRIECRYRSTPPPQRRKRKADNAAALLDRLRAHENLLRNAGLPFESVDDSSDGIPEHDESRLKSQEVGIGQPSPHDQPENVPNPMRRTPPPRRGIMVSEHGGTRYYEHGMIGALGQEYRQEPVDAYNGSPASQQETPDMLAASILSGLPFTPVTPQYQHPNPTAIMNYWTIFVENIHPLTQVIHTPTMHRYMLDSTAYGSKSIEALRFAIYACAVSSLTDKDCHRIFGETKSSLLHLFQSAVRYLLLGASFLKVPDIDLLRAYVLLLTSMLHTSEASSLWLLMGTTIRMAQSQGLHRDAAPFGFSPFESEMRRRLWWYIVSLDSRVTELMGSESCLPKSMNTPLPANVNNSDLEPAMTKPPKSRQGASEMTFCLVRYVIHRYLLEHDPKTYGSKPQDLPRPEDASEIWNVSGLESHLEQAYLRFCDPVIPVQFLTTTVARSTICKLRQMEHHHRSRPKLDDPKAPMLPDTSSKTLSIAARNIQYDNLIHSNRSLRGFLWHVHFCFPWGAPIFLLRKLTTPEEWTEDMHAAWEQMEEHFAHHPEYLEADKVIFLIVSDLTLKAWAAREAVLEAKGLGKPAPPAFITALQQRQTAFDARHMGSRVPGGIQAAFLGDQGNFEGLAEYNANAAGVGFGMVDPSFVGVDWPSWGDY